MVVKISVPFGRQWISVRLGNQNRGFSRRDFPNAVCFLVNSWKEEACWSLIGAETGIFSAVC